MFSLIPRPTIFAHRGSSAHAPENTLAAFHLAVRQGADAIELDAKLCADGQIVVIHDQTVDRTTQGKGRVDTLTLEELKRLDAGSCFDIAFQGESIPTLEEVFSALGHLTYINVELTNYASLNDALPLKTALLVRKYDLQQRVLFSSFNPLALLKARRALPEVPIGLLALPGKQGAWARSWLGRLVPHQALHTDLGAVTPRLVAGLKKRGKRLHVYTINSAEEMKRLFSMGADGVFTDDPVLAHQALTIPDR